MLEYKQTTPSRNHPSDLADCVSDLQKFYSTLTTTSKGKIRNTYKAVNTRNSTSLLPRLPAVTVVIKTNDSDALKCIGYKEGADFPASLQKKCLLPRDLMYAHHVNVAYVCYASMPM